MSNGETRWEVTVPANAHAELPLRDAASWLLEGQPLAKSTRLRAEAGGNGETTMHSRQARIRFRPLSNRALRFGIRGAARQGR